MDAEVKLTAGACSNVPSGPHLPAQPYRGDRHVQSPDGGRPVRGSPLRDSITRRSQCRRTGVAMRRGSPVSPLGIRASAPGGGRPRTNCCQASGRRGVAVARSRVNGRPLGPRIATTSRGDPAQSRWEGVRVSPLLRDFARAPPSGSVSEGGWGVRGSHDHSAIRP